MPIVIAPESTRYPPIQSTAATPESGEEQRQRVGERPAAGGSQVALEQLFQLGLEALVLRLLLGEGAHDPAPGDVLLQRGGHHAELLLHPENIGRSATPKRIEYQIRNGSGASATAASSASMRNRMTVDDDEGADRQHERAHRHHQHRADVVDVVGRAGHQLPGLGAVVERERQRCRWA